MSTFKKVYSLLDDRRLFNLILLKSEEGEMIKNKLI